MQTFISFTNDECRKVTDMYMYRIFSGTFLVIKSTGRIFNLITLKTDGHGPKRER